MSETKTAKITVTGIAMAMTKGGNKKKDGTLSVSEPYQKLTTNCGVFNAKNGTFEMGKSYDVNYTELELVTGGVTRWISTGKAPINNIAAPTNPLSHLTPKMGVSAPNTGIVEASLTNAILFYASVYITNNDRNNDMSVEDNETYWKRIKANYQKVKEEVQK